MTPSRYSPWVLKRRPAGDWVIDQVDRQKGTIRRFGTYKFEAEAKEILVELRRVK